MNSSKDFIYFPSFSSAGVAPELKQDFRFSNGTPCRFYSKDMGNIRYPYFLISAGANFRNKDARKDFGLSDDVLVVGDSGGFQIKTGNLQWKPELKETILRWLEDNCDIAMNLDIPPGGKVFTDYDECLKMSADNFEYFAKNRIQGKADFINILQAGFDHRTMDWYNGVKDFEFEGWSIGGVQGSKLSSMLYAIAILLDGKEHLKQNNKWLHLLGTAKISDFFMLQQLQKSLDSVGSNMRVTTDSSSPDYAVVFGGYYMNYSLKRMNIESVNFPKKEDIFNNDLPLPSVTKFDEMLNGSVTYRDVFEWTRSAFACMSTHNLYVLVDCINTVKEIMNSHDGLIEQIVNRDLFKLLNSIDEMVKSDSPIEVYRKYEPLYLKLSNPNQESKVITNTFF